MALARWRHHALALRWVTPLLAGVVLLAGACTSQRSPTPTALPPPTLTATPGPGGLRSLPPTPVPDTLARLSHVFPEPPEADISRLAREALRVVPPFNVATPPPGGYAPGTVETFTLIDSGSPAMRQVEAELLHVSPNAYWYVQRGVSVSRADIERAAQVFEEQVLPRLALVFGRGWEVGPNGDPRLTVLHVRLQGAAGYVTALDYYPRDVRRASNERTMLYIDIGRTQVGSRPYFSTLAHELQHVLHVAADRSEAAWVNEGLSEVASAVAGYQPSWVGSYLRAPEHALVNWSIDAPSILGNYGAATLFFQYLMEHYGGLALLRAVMEEPAQGAAGVEAALRRMGYDVTFHQVFADWAVANVAGAGQGPYGYGGRDVMATVSRTLRAGEQLQGALPQSGVSYVELQGEPGRYLLRFAGATETPLVPLVPPSGAHCWWGNRGDGVASSLTTSLDLRWVGEATLRYKVWHHIEQGWDYAYVQVSTNGGATWRTLEAPSTTRDDPVGNGFGPGYTGASVVWLTEEVDLTPFTGQEVLLRFLYVTDDAMHGFGLCLDDIAVPETGFLDDAEGTGGLWQAEGFVRVARTVPQFWVLRVVELGEEVTVTDVPMDASGYGELAVALRRGVRTLVVVSPLAPGTFEEAGYAMALVPASS